jgi:predicted phosphoribosyltransferase
MRSWLPGQRLCSPGYLCFDYVDVADVRQNFYNVRNVYDLFTNVADDTILKFLKEIDLYTQI